MVDSYPTIPVDKAADLLDLLRKGLLTQEEVTKRTVGKFPDLGQAAHFEPAIYRLLELADKHKLHGAKKTAAFDSDASVQLHRECPLSDTWVRDLGFWRWLTFSFESTGATIIDARYGSVENPGSARDEYYGLGRINQAYFPYLWFRASSSYNEADKEDPYRLAKAISDVDFWWSHVIRVEYGCCPSIVRQFIKFVVDNNIERGKTNDPSTPAGFRDLARELRRRFATISFEMMDDDQAAAFIYDLWVDRKIWCEKD